MVNFFVRFIEKIGKSTVTGAEKAVKRAQEFSLTMKEQDEAARTLLEKKKEEEKERKREIETKLFKIKEAVDIGDFAEENESLDFNIEREELEQPFSERLVNILSEMFSGYSKKPSSFFENIQEDLYKANIMMPASKYIATAIGVSVFVAAIMALLLGILLWMVIGALGALLGVVMGGLVGLFSFFYAKIYPRSKVKSRSDAFSRELPFALRHMATQLTSGSGLLETMRSVSQSNYGELSEEFKRAILEVERGATVEEAFERMNLRIDSGGLKKSSRQIISTLRTGGNLATTLKVIAEETASEMRMKLKDFIQILNTFSLMYMFLVVVGPVLITTLIIAMGIATKSIPVTTSMMWLIYLAFFGMSVYMSLMIKRFEPKV